MECSLDFIDCVLILNESNNMRYSTWEIDPNYEDANHFLFLPLL